MTTDKALFVIFFTATVLLIIGLAMLFVSTIKERRREDRAAERARAMKRHPAGKGLVPINSVRAAEGLPAYSGEPDYFTEKGGIISSTDANVIHIAKAPQKVLYKHKFKVSTSSNAYLVGFDCEHCGLYVDVPRGWLLAMQHTNELDEAARFWLFQRLQTTVPFKPCPYPTYEEMK